MGQLGKYKIPVENSAALSGIHNPAEEFTTPALVQKTEIRLQRSAYAVWDRETNSRFIGRTRYHPRLDQESQLHLAARVRIASPASRDLAHRAIEKVMPVSGPIAPTKGGVTRDPRRSTQPVKLITSRLVLHHSEDDRFRNLPKIDGYPLQVQPIKFSVARMMIPIAGRCLPAIVSACTHGIVSGTGQYHPLLVWSGGQLPEPDEPRVIQVLLKYYIELSAHVLKSWNPGRRIWMHIRKSWGLAHSFEKLRGCRDLRYPIGHLKMSP